MFKAIEIYCTIGCCAAMAMLTIFAIAWLGRELLDTFHDTRSS